ncbi:3-hydroxyacyl-CoA dehydrogenase NAD-binding domain-containing protein [Gemmata sp.]|uniref:3-hydroxyacyl-CoA dehydrogenase NAD-binding domain-containing protein n=1 Tax=Gemmata sp. TaxID=1914242 RepID=UPI003F722B57
MTDHLKHLRIERDARGVATVTFDVQGAPFNVFNDEVIGELRAVIDALERDPPRVVVFRSGKPSGFFAGADVNRIQQLEHADEVRAVVDAGHSTFARLERLPCPTVAVIHGPCLGGGLEFALACRHRVARDDAATKLGLPETSLGLIPGWGGTQRLPRLVGLRQALKMILEGANLSASKAAAIGLVDVAAPAESFDAAVSQFIDDRLNGRSARHPTRKLLDTLLDATAPGRAVVFAAARKKLAKKARDYPALPAALRAIEAGYRSPGAAGYHAEREGFVSVVFSPVARSLIGLFFQREKARKPSTWVRGTKPATVKRAAVVGAGTMGAGIAQLLAFNGVPVALKDISEEIVAGGMKKVAALTATASSKGLLTREAADDLVRRVTPTTEWGPLAGCDLVIEAVVEREDVKRTVFRELAEKLGPRAVLASNTSALSVSRIAGATPHPERVAGLHFFNPVHRMQLVEVVRGRDTGDATVATLVELVRKLGKVPVVVADSPGFLVNRTLFPYLDEAVRLVLEGVSGEEVDRAAVRFGMPMGPLELLDQIGVDIAADVSKTFAALTSDPGPVPARFAEMVAAGALGKKAGRGFYTYDGDRRGKPTEWATPRRARRPEGAAAGELSEVQKRLVYPMINEAAKCLGAGVVAEAWAADLAMVLGTGFAPFRGGPLRTADSLGVARVVRELDELRAAHGPRFEPAELLRHTAREGHGFYADTRALAHV